MVLWRATRSFRANTQKRCPFRDRTSLVAQMVKHLPTMWETGIDPWVGKIPWGRKWQLTPVLLPGKSHGQRSLVGHSPWGHRVRHDWTTSLHVTFHDRGLECKSKKSRNTWSNRHIWPWSTEWSRAKANRVLTRECTVIANTLFQQHNRRLYTWTSPDGQHWNHINYILCSQR